MANISNVIQVSLQKEPKLAQRTNINAVALFTSEQGKVLNSNNRTAIYTDIDSVANDFGVNSETYSFAEVFFSQTPNPIGVGGYLVIAYWRAKDETIPATSATLKSPQLSEDVIVGQLQQITDGSFEITIDNAATPITITGLDFSTALSLDDIANIINNSLSTAGATCYVDNGSVIIQSNTTGSTSALTYLTDAGVGTFIGGLLKLTEGSGATLTQGQDAITLTPETKLEALQAAGNTFKAFTFIDTPTDAEREELADYAQANNIIGVDVFSGENYLQVDPNNVVWKIKLKGQTNYRMLYSKSNDRKLAIGVMSRMHSVNFGGSNVAITEHLKDIVGVIPDDYTQTEINNAYNVGLDIYTTIKDVPVLLTSPANDFYDNVYNLMAYIDAVETDLFNLLKGTTTKIPQTIKGINALADALEKTTEQFVRAGVFAPGEWTLPNTFGNPDMLKKSIRTKGYYIYINPLALQPQSERQARKSPVIQIAVKNAGAIHQANVIIQFNL